MSARPCMIHSRGSIWKFCIQNFEWNFIILNFTIHHGNPNYTIFCLISVQSYVYTRFFNGWTWCNLSCPWFEWIFEMSMNKTQLPINGIIKFRKIFAKILKDSEKFWKLGKLNFSFFRIWKMRLSLARMMSVWNISIKRTSGILLTYGHFRIRTFFISKSKFRNVFFCNKWPTWIYTSVRYKLFAQKFIFFCFWTFWTGILRLEIWILRHSSKYFSEIVLLLNFWKKLWNWPKIFDHEWAWTVLSEKRYEN